MAGDIHVRSATVDDVDLLHRFSIDLATYEDEPHAVLLELFTDEGVGTQVLPGVATKTRKARA